MTTDHEKLQGFLSDLDTERIHKRIEEIDDPNLKAVLIEVGCLTDFMTAVIREAVGENFNNGELIYAFVLLGALANEKYDEPQVRTAAKGFCKAIVRRIEESEAEELVVN